MIAPARGWPPHIVEASDVLVVCEELCGALLQQSVLVFFAHSEPRSVMSTVTVLLSPAADECTVPAWATMPPPVSACNLDDTLKDSAIICSFPQRIQ